MTVETISTKQQLDKLLDVPTLVFRGYVPTLDTCADIFELLSKLHIDISEANIVDVKGKLMNDFYHLTGDNRYKDDLDILIVVNFKGTMNPIISYLLDLTDFYTMVYENSEREKRKKIQNLSRYS